MKKSLLALLISSLIGLSACEDSNLPQKVFETEKKIVQLESDFNRVTKELVAKETELDELKRAYETLKTEQDNAKQAATNIPALNVKIESLYHKTEKLKFKKDPKDEFAREESEITVSIDVPVTNIDWLDQILLNQAYQNFGYDDGKDKAAQVTKPMLVQMADELFQSHLANAREDKPIGLDNVLSAFYLGQRNNIATFRYIDYTYEGGAHGIHSTQYLNIDANKKAVISLNDLISPKNQAELKAILWRIYESDNLDENGKYSGSVEKAEFRIPDNFYFKDGDIVFVYGVYELGSYAEGNVELTVARYEINDLLNADYQYTQDDGFEKGE
ncbi:DUF3298 domain-containing protein [Muribacter muris]|uniref:DUF3298 domain-containing protein n=1 Tax=Muribacter muris TaxID=67855 RepID=A0A4Y9JZB1_9PAST|nr:RsiV family protein [Muribacter muris]MBF0784939.1 DUF3298 domain-containing protein [Muribacter muris]MBF0827247.1 DUF3298 domain-containing protein [Muribacter muris]TFV10858.1 DUF3298 domain-containing protein [Muribacter muris]